MILSIVANTSLSPVHPNDDHLSLNVMILVTVACVLSVFLSTVLLYFFFPPFRGWLEMGNQLFARHVAPLALVDTSPFGSSVLCVLHPSVYRCHIPRTATHPGPPTYLAYPFPYVVPLKLTFNSCILAPDKKRLLHPFLPPTFRVPSLPLLKLAVTICDH
ncbi:hypothetical protein IW261DRAFT_592073 [Armillaria novae-zelandiae]|uniref:Uncharacterized protein n=1 Tax=Armillaria novae-zelandiae TaxID=153914 RepID=A0AA39UH32_9AGAR|nr:hypothetical protein IW261DRAFT_592073 [Armillaria novae-zelandiae]